MVVSLADPTSPEPREPKYYIVKRHLLELIDNLEPGALVPTERDLTARLGTSRTTVRQALGELVGEGRLVRRQGSGTFVAEPKIAWPLQMTSFTAQAAAFGYVVTTELLNTGRMRADADVAARLGLRVGAPVWEIERLRLVDGSPMAVETSHLGVTRFPGLVGELRRSGSLYTVLKDVYGVEPSAADETIETAAASPREAALLHTDTGSPMLVLGRHTFDAVGEPFEWVRSWYRGDRYTFVARLTAPTSP